MAFLSELKRNRIRLLEEFLQDRELVTLITDDDAYPLPAIDLQYSQVFPYPWIDGTITEKKVFLSFGLTSSRKSDTLKNIIMHIWVYMHKDLAPMSDCIRSDAIVSRIDELINGKIDYGVTDVEFMGLEDLLNLPVGMCGCYLKYAVKDINKLCGVR